MPEERIRTENLPVSYNPSDFIGHEEQENGKRKLSRIPRDILAGMISGSASKVVVATKADLDVLLDFPEWTGGEVWQDPVSSRNGVYRKRGVKGAGDWLRIADLNTAESAARNLVARDLTVIPLVSVSHDAFNKLSVTVLNNGATTGIDGTGTYGKYEFTAISNNTGPMLIRFNGGEYVPLLRSDGTAMRGGDIKFGETYYIRRRANNTFRLTNREVRARTFDGGLQLIGAAVAQSLGNQISWDTGRPALSFVGAGWYAAQPVAGRDELIRCVNTGGTVDLSWLSVGRAVRLYAITQTFVYAGDNPTGVSTGPSFFGQAANINRASLPTGTYAVIRCIQTNPTRLVFETLPAGVTYSAFNRPPMNFNVLLAGQSHMVIGGSSGAIGGFSREMMTSDMMLTTSPAVEPKNYYFTQGATGGTAAVKGSVEPDADNYWWNENTNQPGPMLDNCVAKINAAVALNQPWPAVMLWAQGDGDGLDIQFGTTRAYMFKRNTLAIWNYLRAYKPPGWPTGTAAPMSNMKVIVFPPGSVDNYFTTTGMLAERTAFLELTEEPGTSAWVSYGGEMYDLPRNFGQEHLTDDGCYAFGQRWALAVSRALFGRTIDRGPILESAIYYTSRNVLEIKVRGDSANGSSPWPIPDPGATDDSLNPYGFQIARGAITAEATLISDVVPIKVLDAKCIYNSANAFRRLTFEFVMESDPTGAICYSVANWAQHQWQRTYPMSLVQHAPAVSVPINFQRVTITSAA